MTEHSTYTSHCKKVISVLSQDEIVCLGRLAYGAGIAEIGRNLHLDETEIELLIAGAEGKLGARNRMHAVSVAMLSGLIGGDALGPDLFGIDRDAFAHA